MCPPHYTEDHVQSSWKPSLLTARKCGSPWQETTDRFTFATQSRHTNQPNCLEDVREQGCSVSQSVSNFWSGHTSSRQTRASLRGRQGGVDRRGGCVACFIRHRLEILLNGVSPETRSSGSQIWCMRLVGYGSPRRRGKCEGYSRSRRTRI